MSIYEVRLMVIVVRPGADGRQALDRECQSELADDLFGAVGASQQGSATAPNREASFEGAGNSDGGRLYQRSDLLLSAGRPFRCRVWRTGAVLHLLRLAARRA